MLTNCRWIFTEFSWVLNTFQCEISRLVKNALSDPCGELQPVTGIVSQHPLCCLSYLYGMGWGGGNTLDWNDSSISLFSSLSLSLSFSISFCRYSSRKMVTCLVNVVFLLACLCCTTDAEVFTSIGKPSYLWSQGVFLHAPMTFQKIWSSTCWFLLDFYFDGMTTVSYLFHLVFLHLAVKKKQTAVAMLFLSWDFGYHNRTT